MPLTKPTLTGVSGGEPITAQGWNAIVSGLDGLYDAVIALGGATLEVPVTGPAPEDVVVVAEPLGEGRPVRALPPFGTRAGHLLVGLTDGPWRVHVAAHGYVTESRDVTLPSTDPLPVTLTTNGVVVPDFFGVPTRAVLDRLRALGIEADALLDTTGREVSRVALPPEYADAPVLFQLPQAGTVVPVGSGRVRLVVASALRRDPVVTMPSLIGLSMSEARQVLDRLGLVLGETSVRTGVEH
jgi:hypothetical protein